MSEPIENAPTESVPSAQRTDCQVLEAVERRRHLTPIAGIFVEADKIVTVCLENVQEIYLVVCYSQGRCPLLTLSTTVHADAKRVFDAFGEYLNNGGSLDAISAAIAAVSATPTTYTADAQLAVRNKNGNVVPIFTSGATVHEGVVRAH
jgi:hypothetical protein